MTNNIASLLRQRKWTQRKLAQKAGLETAHVNKVIKKTTNPRVETAIRIAQALGMKVEEIWKS